MMAQGKDIRELKLGDGDEEKKVVEEICRLERRIFPKHESLSASLQSDLAKKKNKKNNSGLLYALGPSAPPNPNPSPGPSLSRNTNGGRDRITDELALVGYVMYSFPTSLTASVSKLAVRESYRRQGYGESLLIAAINKCRERSVHRVSLHVDPARPAAVSLYRKLGFEVDTLVKSYYAPHRDAYRMFLDFDLD